MGVCIYYGGMLVREVFIIKFFGMEIERGRDIIKS